MGVVTSPHTYHFGERLRIGMRPAGDALAPHLQRAVDVILEARRRNDAVLGAATQFDAFVAAALKAAQKCDAVVVEVGLGGRRDSTNFLQAPITALVSVEREHTEVLGESLRGIAAEKAGICTKDGVLVLGDLGRAPREKAVETARKRGATPLATRPERIIQGIPAGSLAVARGVLDAVPATFVDGGLLDDPQVLRTALKALPAHAESIKGGYVDGAHTAKSVAAFAKSIKRRGRGVVLIIALRADKDVESVAGAVREHLNPERVVCCSCGEGFVDAGALASAFVGAEVASSPAAAFDAVPCGEYVRVALGSFEIAAAARAAWL